VVRLRAEAAPADAPRPKSVIMIFLFVMQNVMATLYRVLGIDPSMTIPDHNGRPQYLLETREPVAGLI
jgi:hypothetical protein